MCVAGDGMIYSENVVRLRIGCAPDVQVTYENMAISPRPAAFPGKQNISCEDYYFQGRVYSQSIRSLDFAYFVGPSDVEEFQMYAGYYLVHRNVTRVCVSYIPEDCLLTSTADACLNQAIQSHLDQEAGLVAGKVNLAAVIAGPVVSGMACVLLLCHLSPGLYLLSSVIGSAENNC